MNAYSRCCLFLFNDTTLSVQGAKRSELQIPPPVVKRYFRKNKKSTGSLLQNQPEDDKINKRQARRRFFSDSTAEKRSVLKLRNCILWNSIMIFRIERKYVQVLKEDVFRSRFPGIFLAYCENISFFRALSFPGGRPGHKEAPSIALPQ